MLPPWRNQHRRVPVGRLAAAPVLGFVVLALSACGSQGGSGSGATHDARNGDHIKIVYGQIQSSTNHLPLYVAIRRGFFQKAGLEVSMQSMSGGTPATMAAMKAGAINIMGAGAAEFVEYVGKKVVEGKMFGQVADRTYDVIVTKNTNSILELKGQPIGISGLNGGDHIYIQAVLEHYGLGTGDITFITLGSATNRLTALLNGAVKAVAVPNDRRSASASVGRVILKSGDSPIDIPGGMYLASAELLEHHRPELERFLLAMGEATAWIRDNREASVADCVAVVETTPQECRSAIDFNLDPAQTGPEHWSATEAMNRDGIAQAIKIVGELEPDLRGVTVDDVADFRIANVSPKTP
jgi:NitT/TauT family transport system substrate-binding protein